MSSVGVRETFGAASDFVAKVNAFGPDLIAVSATEDMFLLGIALLKRIKKHKIPVLLGGVFSTFAPKLALSYDEIDMVCVGEGERCIVELCKRMQEGKNFIGVPNLYYKDRHGIIYKNKMGSPWPIDDTPLPDLEIFHEWRIYRPMAGKVYKMLPVETHRGCPYLCAYCNSPTQSTLYQENVGESYFRKKSLEYIRREIEFYVNEWGVEYLYFWADTFLAWNKKQFDAFCDMYSDFKLPFWCQTRPETVTEYNLGRLKEVGLDRLSFGVEHGDEKFRAEHINRKLKNEKVISALKIPHELDISFSVNNIVGFPFETRELAQATIELNRQIQSSNMNCYAFTPFHGTPLREVAEKEGLITPDVITRSLTRGSILNMKNFSREAIEGFIRTFVLYVKFPKNRWKEISIAEKFTDEGNVMWERLRKEYQETFYASGAISEGIEESAQC